MRTHESPAPCRHQGRMVHGRFSVLTHASSTQYWYSSSSEWKAVAQSRMVWSVKSGARHQSRSEQHCCMAQRSPFTCCNIRSPCTVSTWMSPSSVKGVSTMLSRGRVPASRVGEGAAPARPGSIQFCHNGHPEGSKEDEAWLRHPHRFDGPLDTVIPAALGRTLAFNEATRGRSTSSPRITRKSSNISRR